MHSSSIVSLLPCIEARNEGRTQFCMEISLNELSLSKFVAQWECPAAVRYRCCNQQPQQRHLFIALQLHVVNSLCFRDFIDFNFLFENLPNWLIIPNLLKSVSENVVHEDFFRFSCQGTELCRMQKFAINNEQKR